LAEDDQQRRAKGEAEHHRMRDEIDQRPDAQDAEQPLEGASEKGQQQHGLDVLRAAQRRQRGHRTEQQHRDRRGGTAHQVARRAPQAGDRHWQHRRVQAVLRWQAGDQRIGHRLRQCQDCAIQADPGLAPEHAPVQPR